METIPILQKLVEASGTIADRLARELAAMQKERDDYKRRYEYLRESAKWTLEKLDNEGPSSLEFLQACNGLRSWLVC